MKDYWQLVLTNLKSNLSKSNYDAWFSQVQFSKTSNNGRKLVLEVPSVFNKQYLEKKFNADLKKAVLKYYPQVIHIDYQISEKGDSQKEIQDGIFPIQENSGNLKETLKKAETRNIDLNRNGFNRTTNIHNLNPKYTFENFVENNSNQLATNVAKAIIARPGTHYNPVFLYSSVGLGKTHLLQAIGHKIMENSPSLKIKYATSEMFFNHFIASIQNKNGNSFQEYYRSVDVLLIDDIQFISGKEATQEAFFHAFNELHQNNKQIVITSDKHPKSLAALEDRLISRFEWGIVIDISKPEFEDRLSVLKFKAKKLNLNLTESQLVKIASGVNSNFRDLEGVLNRIEARIKLIPDRAFEDFELNKILSGSSLGSTVSISVNYTPKSTGQILTLVGQVSNLSTEEILGTSRQADIAGGRQLAMYCCKEFLGLSLPAVGKVFKRDHTTIMHAVKKINKAVEAGDTNLANKIAFIKQSLA